MKTTENKDYVLAARARHHEALKAMMPADSTLSGLAVWRKLRVLECKASRLALQMCNGPEVSEDEKERIDAQVTAGVEELFCRPLPGFFINHDPRGYALKLETGSVPHALHEDWGRYQILAPLID
jgi:hypothetical protein